MHNHNITRTARGGFRAAGRFARHMGEGARFGRGGGGGAATGSASAACSRMAI